MILACCWSHLLVAFAEDKIGEAIGATVERMKAIDKLNNRVSTSSEGEVCVILCS